MPVCFPAAATIRGGKPLRQVDLVAVTSADILLNLLKGLSILALGLGWLKGGQQTEALIGVRLAAIKNTQNTILQRWQDIRMENQRSRSLFVVNDQRPVVKTHRHVGCAGLPMGDAFKLFAQLIPPDTGNPAGKWQPC